MQSVPDAHAGGADIVYRVDALDRICEVNAEYDAFALANAGAEAVSTRVLERSLWDFVGDATTRELYRLILQRARAGNAVRFALRCDSPRFRRRLVMQVASPDGRAVEFRVRIESCEEREPQALLASAGTSGWLVGCSWCKRYQIDGAWAEVEETVAKLELFERDDLPAVSHGICPECAAAMKASIQ